MPEQGQEETVRIVALDRSFHVNCYVCEVRMKPEPVLYHKPSTVLHWTDWSVCPPGMRAPAVLRGGGPRLLPTGRPHPVQELQRSAHPGPVGQNLHWLLTWKHPCKASGCVALGAVAAVASLTVGWGGVIVCYRSGPGGPAALFHFIQKPKRFLFPPSPQSFLAWPAGSLGSVLHSAIDQEHQRGRVGFICRKVDCIIAHVLWKRLSF